MPSDAVRNPLLQDFMEDVPEDAFLHLDDILPARFLDIPHIRRQEVIHIYQVFGKISPINTLWENFTGLDHDFYEWLLKNNPDLRDNFPDRGRIQNGFGDEPAEPYDPNDFGIPSDTVREILGPNPTNDAVQSLRDFSETFYEDFFTKNHHKTYVKSWVRRAWFREHIPNDEFFTEEQFDLMVRGCNEKFDGVYYVQILKNKTFVKNWVHAYKATLARLEADDEEKSFYAFIEEIQRHFCVSIF